MSELRFVCTAIGAFVLATMVLSLVWFVVAICVEAWRDCRRVYVPRAWLAEHDGRGCDRQHPSSGERR